VARLKHLTRPETYNTIPHGFDGTHFKKMPKKAAREKFRFSSDWFIVGNVNRNQSRKRQDLSIRAFAEFAKDKPNARLVLHCVRADIKGWDLTQLAQYYDVADKIIFTHEFFQGKEATLEQLNVLYNTFDVQINTGGGEGWGLTSFEGAGVGVPQVVPNWSATKEIWEGSGKLIGVATVRHEPYMINTMQAVIDTTHCANILTELYENKAMLEEVGDACQKITEQPKYSWENIGAQFDDLLINAVGTTPKATPVAFTAKGVQALKKKGIIK
jgi:glycosyltransferase involved in cell wall biosynthesis